MALALSILALLATFYQAYLQRVHNEKSVKPLVQIDMIDRNGRLAVQVRNNGMGPYIIKKLEFFQNGRSYFSIDNCLTLDPKTYQFIPITELSSKIILPEAYLSIFSLQRDATDTDQEINDIRQQLASLNIKVEGSDIYDNKIIIERDLNWFMKYSRP